MSRVSRRALLSSGAAASIFAATGLSVSAAPRRGGSLRIGVMGGLEQSSAHGIGHSVIRMATHDCLTEVAADGTLRGELATAWEASENGCIWTLRLAERVTFSDGSPLTPSDVTASLGNLRGLQGIEVLDSQTLRIVLGEAAPDLPFRLAKPQHAITRGGHTGPEALGTGLYRITGVADTEYHLTRVADHRKDGRAGWFDTVHVAGALSHEARMNALLEGRVDVVDALDPALVARLEKKDRLDVAAVRGSGAWTLEVSGTGSSAPIAATLRDAIDQATLAEAVFRGFAPRTGMVSVHGLHSDIPARLPLVLDRDLMKEPVVLRAVSAIRTMAAGAGIDVAPTLRTPDRGVHLTLGYSYNAPATILPDTSRVYVFADYLCAHCARLRHLGRLGASYPLDSARIAERWWFA